MANSREIDGFGVVSTILCLLPDSATPLNCIDMLLGIDFGTTRVVVALVDRGNFPLVNFEAPDGLVHDWFPPVAAVNGSRRVYGWEAIAAQEDEDWTVLRS